MWCQDNNLSLNVIKTKKMIVDYRKRSTEHTPDLIDLFSLRRLKRCGMGPQILKRFYSYSVCIFTLITLPTCTYYLKYLN
jgi:predicted acetyltransferase